jgi:protein-S-isoprenylcysteine O-methyltransferase Ste14
LGFHRRPLNSGALPSWFPAKPGYAGGLQLWEFGRMRSLMSLFIPACWLIWAVIWFAAARRVKKTARQEEPLSRLSNTLPLWVAAFLLAVPQIWPRFLTTRLLPESLSIFGIGAAMLAVGLGFAIWARYHLGRNWSGVITVKEDHELVRTGPYHLVRHPIYTGLLLAIIGSAIARGGLGALIAVGLVLYAVLRRVKVEERWMEETFGAVYDDYRASTPALVPFAR